MSLFKKLARRKKSLSCYDNYEKDTDEVSPARLERYLDLPALVFLNVSNSVGSGKRIILRYFSVDDS